MAKLMQYTDPDTLAVFPNSVWIPGDINVRPMSKTGILTFWGFASVEAITRPGSKPIAVKKFTLTPQNWDEFFTLSGLNIEALLAPCYQYATLMKEGAPPLDGEEDTRVSFFATATDI